ncbi:hypothetical protein SmJEL517_g03143 [Synchytrium microbalum]|uniref:Uncharacterized protein n=1 Tax=Synchytrium microbalum TaxID=1806994 RepID=A0A507BY25_9FUNG|nr:uncharacterized protein SmJEL517_g03143 [Synchytrium microbalum]TPX34220.1 hypothetical protein SmJEL517_g03143 [Synchytrium microbalum]
MDHASSVQQENAQNTQRVSRKELLAIWKNQKAADQGKPDAIKNKTLGKPLGPKNALSEVTTNGRRNVLTTTVDKQSAPIADPTPSAAASFLSNVSTRKIKVYKSPHKSGIVPPHNTPVSMLTDGNGHKQGGRTVDLLNQSTRSLDLMDEIEAIIGKSLDSDARPTTPTRSIKTHLSTLSPYTTPSEVKALQLQLEAEREHTALLQSQKEDLTRQWQQRVHELEKTLSERDNRHRQMMALQEDEEDGLRGVLSELEARIATLESRLLETNDLHADQVTRLQHDLWEAQTDVHAVTGQLRDVEANRTEWSAAVAQRDLQIVELRACLDDRRASSANTTIIKPVKSTDTNDLVNDDIHSQSNSSTEYQTQLADIQQEVSDAYEVIEALESQIKELEDCKSANEIRIDELEGELLTAQVQLDRAHCEYGEQVKQLQDGLRATITENEMLMERLHTAISEQTDGNSIGVQTEMPLDRILVEVKELNKQNNMLRFRGEAWRHQYMKSQSLHQENVHELTQKMEEDSQKWSATESLIDTLRQQLIDAVTKSIQKTNETEIKYQSEKRKADMLEEQLKSEREQRRKIEKTVAEHFCMGSRRTSSQDTVENK